MKSQAAGWIFLLVLTPWLTGCGADDRRPVANASSHSDQGHGGATHNGSHDDHTGPHSIDEGHGGHASHDAHGGAGAGHAQSRPDPSRPDPSRPDGKAHEGHGNHSHAEQPLPAGAKRPAAVEPKVKVKNGKGDNVFSIKWKEDGAKLVDPREQELARYNLDGTKMKIKDPRDQVLGYLVGAPSQGRVKIEDPTQEKELFKLIRQEDGDWKLEDGADRMLVRMKVRDYGAELESEDDTSLFKVKIKDGKTSLRDASDQTVYYTNTPISAMAFACLGLEAIEDLRIRAALTAYLQVSASDHH